MYFIQKYNLSYSQGLNVKPAVRNERVLVPQRQVGRQLVPLPVMPPRAPRAPRAVPEPAPGGQLGAGHPHAVL